MAETAKRKNLSLPLTLTGLTVINFVLGILFLLGSIDCLTVNLIGFSYWSINCDVALIFLIIGTLHLITVVSIFSAQIRVLNIGLLLNLFLIYITIGFMIYLIWLVNTYELPKPPPCVTSTPCFLFDLIDEKPIILNVLKITTVYLVFNLLSLFGILKVKREIAKS